MSHTSPTAFDDIYSTSNYATGSASNSAEPTFIILFYLICCIIYLPFMIFWIWMIVDIAKRQFDQGKEDLKLPWLLAIIFGGIIPAIVYFFSVKKNDSQTKAVNNTDNTNLPSQQ